MHKKETVTRSKFSISSKDDDSFNSGRILINDNVSETSHGIFY